ncbi:hypothetical protein GGR88_000403 [Sphingomonas jejuensis]|jgi:uncharacterized protein|uniref:Peptidase C39 domain-containing protein n=1 Tax=Sphingomonas jejuensis TaxID=904715 RepID=A0ABX0XI69_9SPHN|nr:C39 family peptidase [Sphingomonas jejuensis]NJC32929.1 hypothetical protein [Sphingomonas jejuensis]
MLAVGGCAASISPEGARFLTTAGPTGDYGLALRSVEDRRFDGVVRQRFDFSCGSAALATLLRHHYADRIDERQTFLGMWRDGDQAQIRRVGFSLLDMKRYLAGRRLAADGYQVTLDQVAQAGVPGIALISIRNYKHFVVVKGVTPTDVLVGDPSTGMQVYPRDRFQAAWNGIYFVINDRQDQGRAAFNRGTQWATVARAPVGTDFHDPLSLQALSITAPFYRDF